MAQSASSDRVVRQHVRRRLQYYIRPMVDNNPRRRYVASVSVAFFLAMVDDGYFNFPRRWRFHRRHIGTSRASSSKSKLILFCVAVSVHSCPSAAAVVRPKSKSSLSSSIVRPTSWWILEDARRRFHGGHISTMARRKKILLTGGHRRRRDV